MKILIFLSLIGFLLLSSCVGSNSNKPQTNQTNIEKWYEGGTLHKAKISEWKSATYKNKLATCADFMATVDNTVSMVILKQRAQSLVTCIDESIKELDNTNSESVSSIASLCTKTMVY